MFTKITNRWFYEIDIHIFIFLYLVKDNCVLYLVKDGCVLGKFLVREYKDCIFWEMFHVFQYTESIFVDQLFHMSHSKMILIYLVKKKNDLLLRNEIVVMMLKIFFVLNNTIE